MRYTQYSLKPSILPIKEILSLTITNGSECPRCREEDIPVSERGKISDKTWYSKNDIHPENIGRRYVKVSYSVMHDMT